MKSFIAALTLVAVGLAFTSTSFAAEKKEGAKKAPPKQLTGVVEACDAGCIKIKGRQETKMFVVDAKTKVSTADKKEAAISDIKCGDKVTVFFAERGGQEVAVRIAPPAPPKKKVEKK
jgi:Cu/Ag efflux protein CusF